MRRVAFLSFDWDYGVVTRFYLGLQDYLQNRDDIQLIIFSAYGHHAARHDPDDGAFEIFTLCDISQYDGFLIQGNRTWPPEMRQRFVDEARAQHKPVVSINYELEGAYYVGTNNYEAMYGLISTILSDRSCTKPLFVNGHAASVEAQERARAYRDACANAGITDAHFYQANWQIEDGVATAHELLQHKDDLPDVVFCCNDDLAVGLTETLQQNGIDIPGDLMVTGFDNREMSLRTFPRITTVDRDFHTIAQIALRTLELAMSGENPPHTTSSPVRYVLAESCRYPTEYEKGIISDIYNMDQSLKHFYEVLSLFQSSVFAADSLEMVLRDCERFAPAVACPGLYLSINDSYLCADDNQSASTYAPVSHLMACAGPAIPDAFRGGHMNVCYPSKAILPPQIPMDAPVYVILPLHRNEACIGMAIAEGVPPTLNHGFFTFFLTLLSNSIESIRKRQLLQDANMKLDNLYVHDELTGLYNRFGLERYGTVTYEHLLRDFKKAEFVFVDIDNMKGINDVYGHEMGDAAICDTADVIRRTLSDENAFAMRWGGDEFLVICRRFLASRFEDELELLKASTKRPFDLGLSVGTFKVRADDGYSMDEAIKLADAKMYEVKKEHHRR